jgi:hypothetical protein
MSALASKEIQFMREVLQKQFVVVEKSGPT